MTEQTTPEKEVIKEEVVEKEVSRRLPFHYYLLWLVVIISLALNAFIIYELLQVRQQAGVALSQAAASIGALKNSSIDYTVPIDQQIAVAMDVPVKFTVDVPIQQDLAINTTVDIPLDIPLLGTRTITVPINTTVPINLSVKIPVDKSFPVNGMIPVKFDVPINLKLSTTTFGDALGQLQAALQQQADALTTPVKP
jgi:hypothetical protein